ncbi:hypothetical protein [Larkinella rosea]|uniref:Uncharacterized protein n=1 Tax=Larkinella rosea TaxID=2025312 RepID=A0A3P1BLY2_9BACT|nr:hypothetical protein [Larkinella rosea]RRB02057.1 hypothetical protein EHT25_16330 [Larkinella rosea]
MQAKIPNNRELKKLFTNIEKYLNRVRYYEQLMFASGVKEEYIDEFSAIVANLKEQTAKSVNWEFYLFFRNYNDVFYPFMKYLGLGDYYLMWKNEKNEIDGYLDRNTSTREAAFWNAGYYDGFVTFAEKLRPLKKNIDHILQANQESLEVYASGRKVLPPTTRKEEIFYRRGFRYGMEEVCLKANIKFNRRVRMSIPYVTWSDSWLFKIGTPPGETEYENLPQVLAEVLGRR